MRAPRPKRPGSAASAARRAAQHPTPSGAHSPDSPRRHRTGARPLALALAALLALAAPALAAAPAGAAPRQDTPASAVVDSGAGWTVTRAAGGYTVSLTLDRPLPVRNDVPVLVADGAPLGPAAESADGRVLTAATTDPAAASAKKITWQWSSGGASTATGPAAVPSASGTAQARKQLAGGTAPDTVGGAGDTAADPTTAGTGPYTVADYDFGAQSVPLADIGGIRGELEGRVYLPTDKRPHPLVVFLHGRHSACYDTTTLKGVSGWPCPEGTAPILSYAGYDGAGEALAKDGFTVVSISANAVNANDNQLSPDDGAATRGQLVLDTLSMLKKANAGDPVSYHDAATGRDVTLGQALAAGRATSPRGTATAASLVGSMDFSSIGLMGHSRGGEGVVTAGALNEGLAKPWHITSVFALAPIDFTRATLPDVQTTTLLPYCDGDVSDQQGQHFYADSRDAFADAVQRSDVWVMGTDHDFYNSSWTPPYPGASDDWSDTDDPVCGTSAKALASGGNTRLSAQEQYQVGSAYIAGYFESTLGGQHRFDSLFDGSGKEPPSVSGFADVRTVAQQPAPLRDDITSFKATSPLIGTTAAATATVCADKYGRTVPEPYPDCTDPGSTLTNQQLPYWTPAPLAPNVPLNIMTHLKWTGPTGSLSVTLPTAERNVSAYDEMTVSMSPDESVATGTDMTLSVADAAGHRWSSPVSALNPWGVTRMPASASTKLGKIVLQQVHVPTVELAAAGLDLTRVTSVAFTAAPGAGEPAAGGVYLSDLVFDTKGPGTPDAHPRPAVNVASTAAEEGAGPGTDQVAVYLSRPSATHVSAYLTVVGSATGKVGLALQKVDFAPGETCKDVDIPVTGDTEAGAAPSTSYKLGVSDPTEAVLGAGDFGTVSVREDDGVTGGAAAVPPVGVQGDACAEHTALSHPGTLAVAGAAPAPGASVALRGSGFRDGESVAFTLGGTLLGSALAGADGAVALAATVPAGQTPGPTAVTAVGAGSGFTERADVAVLAPTATTLALAPAAPRAGRSFTLTARVSGAGTDGGTVAFTDATGPGTPAVLGTARTRHGTASLKVRAGLRAGTHALTARFGGTATAAPSASAPVQLALAKNRSALAFALSARSTRYGKAVSGVFSVAGAGRGTVRVDYGAGTLPARVGAGGRGSFTLPAALPVGSYTIAARYEGTDAVGPSGTAAQRLVVGKAATSTALTLAKAGAGHGAFQRVTVTVGGRRGGAYPGGTVTVTARAAGASTATRVTLTAAQRGVLTLWLKPPGVRGTATVTAVYGGDARYTASTSPHRRVRLSRSARAS
ncbi:Ig-like domain-containing protein [Streptomyces sp. NPDC047002]|uniref:Ig-like domain-containing protein n=1 Tax=Streptomyces sp. NPDC047002 TaxID=3155475 RepID=UPI0034512651